MSDDYSCVGWDRISEACSSFVNETNDECCICLEHYSNLNSFPCHVSHKMCKNCLDNCYQRKNKKCPMCRSNVPNEDRKSTRLNSSHITRSRMPSSA